jgi:hypothetical protein
VICYETKLEFIVLLWWRIVGLWFDRATQVMVLHMIVIQQIEDIGVIPSEVKRSRGIYAFR